MVLKTACPRCAHLRGDIGRERGPAVVHRQQHAGQAQARVEVVADEIDRREQLAQALQRVVLALDRNEHAVGRGERVDGEQSDRGRAVEQDVVISVAYLSQRTLEAPLSLIQADQLDFGSGEVRCRRDEPQALDLRGWMSPAAASPPTRAG
jgi:hypothetical protein